MSGTVCVFNELDHQNVNRDGGAAAEETPTRAWGEGVRWTTRQVVAACLWSALFGLGCGYAWLLLQLGTAACR